MTTINVYARIGTGTKIHKTDGERAFCNYDGPSKKSQVFWVDPEHLTAKNACSKCFRNFKFDDQDGAAS